MNNTGHHRNKEIFSLKTVPKRILITGNAGSGKTTLAKKIAKQLELSYFSLDSVVWQEGWEKTPTEIKEQKIWELVQKDTWVIDGVSLQVQESADLVVLLDIPRRICFLRVIRRNWRYLFRSRPELPPNCPEIRIIPSLCKIIWNFPQKVEPKIIRKVHGDSENQCFYHIRTKEELLEFTHWVDTLK